MAGKHRTFRTDILTHEKTQELRPLDRDILLTQVIAANIAGIMRKSVEQIAGDADRSGGTKPARVRQALERLERAGMVRWFRKYDIVWAVEAADNQARSSKAWQAVDNVVDVQPLEVKRAFRKHYADRYETTPGDTVSDTLSDTVCPPGNRVKGTGNRAQGTRAGARPKHTPPSTEAELRTQALVVAERVGYEAPRPKPPGRRDELGPPSLNRERVFERLAEGATGDEIVATMCKLSRRIQSGELPPKMWGTMALTGYYGALRDDLPISGQSKPGVPISSAVTVGTVEEAHAYCREHGRLPEGWTWRKAGHDEDAYRGGSHVATRKERSA